MLTEGLGEIGGSVGHTQRRVPSEHGFTLGALGCQRGRAESLRASRRNPAHPKIEPVDTVRPAAYMFTEDDVKEFPKYEKVWKEIFQMR